MKSLARKTVALATVTQDPPLAPELAWGNSRTSRRTAQEHFGVPVSHEEDAERACRAALDMHAGGHQMAESADLGVNRPPNLHIGIDTGLVVAAPIGTGGAQQFTVMGDAVNLASRLCHQAGDGETIIGEATYQSVRRLFAFGGHPWAGSALTHRGLRICPLLL